MKEFKKYIFEKLKLNKDIKNVNSFTITDEDEEQVKDIFTSKDRLYFGYDKEFCKLIASKCRSGESCIKKWVTIMIMTNSVPYINKKTINSVPGNFGSYFIDKGLDNYNLSLEDFMNAYDLVSSNEIHKLPENLFKLYTDLIKVLLDSIIKDKKYSIDFKYSFNDYSKEAIDIINERNGKIALPFEITYNNKSVKCEIVFMIGGTYYNYRVKDKNFKWSSDFLDELKKELNIK